MANTVYEKGSEFSKTLDSKEVSARYDEQISIIAECIGKLQQVENTFKYLTEKTQDNGDPCFEISEVLHDLGITLASTVSYRDEYLKEANDPEENVEE